MNALGGSLLNLRMINDCAWLMPCCRTLVDGKLRRMASLGSNRTVLGMAKIREIRDQIDLGRTEVWSPMSLDCDGCISNVIEYYSKIR
jgi:hypothetical protein